MLRVLDPNEINYIIIDEKKKDITRELNIKGRELLLKHAETI